MKADVMTLALTLSANQAEVLLLDAYYNDAMTTLARAEWFVDVRLIELAADQATVEPPAETVAVVAVCYDDRDLAPTDLMELETLSPTWRDMHGTPYAWTQEDETTATFRMIPVPNVPSKIFHFIHGEPVGIDFPAYVAVAFLAQSKVDVPRWLDLPIALGMCAREFARDSAHADPVFAKACSDLGMLLFGAVNFDAS
jgi:hypothetical protein